MVDRITKAFLVDRIMKVFLCRAGFDGWWDEIDTDIKQEILQELEDALKDDRS